MKKALASSIHALRQQVRDLTNKRKKNMGTGATNNPGVESRVVRTHELEIKKVTPGNEKSPSLPVSQVVTVNSIPVGSSQVASRTVATVSQGKVSCDATGKPGKDGAQDKASPVKRKMVPSGPGAAKVAKVEVESPAVQERGVSSVARRPEAVDVEAGEKLDEMKALCPHDLLGRCNDSACQYQHLPSARPSLPAAPKGCIQGTEPVVATTTLQGGLGKRGASSGKTGARVKVVGDGGVGRSVPHNLTADVVKTVPLEPCIQSSVPEILTADSVKTVPQRLTADVVKTVPSETCIQSSVSQKLTVDVVKTVPSDSCIQTSVQERLTVDVVKTVPSETCIQSSVPQRLTVDVVKTMPPDSCIQSSVPERLTVDVVKTVPSEPHIQSSCQKG
ncbi:hypothetical protein GWK47_047200 [Chionoecetes opilio]|uniref:Putative zinc-finger domain-containing protein n=1 Tax=Chionoecetes opilio TaxID=41210 RepID=A0A8J4Y6I7_CHIOP|nr:hypothetical protein GWK47_047200 [Chionoecetes opilio]